MMKRVLDVAFAGTALVAGAPLLALLSAAIRLDSPGPILFSQTRIGRHKQPIQALKLRTMIVGADRRGPQITAHGDPRITRIGRWLRKTKLDELPQLWNVVRGDMSLVGPRPEVPSYVDEYRPEWEKLFTVRPGLTDVASLAFRDEESLLAAARNPDRAYREVIMPMKLQLALEDLERSSIRHDLGTIARTLVTILRGPAPRLNAIGAEARRRIEQLNRATEDA
jgi:lipopolysaccharide/colanic/teichoic acid biosynthesis glycosyltransferase